jgi:hypothetical protein
VASGERMALPFRKKALPFLKTALPFWSRCYHSKVDNGQKVESAAFVLDTR